MHRAPIENRHSFSVHSSLRSLSLRRRIATPQFFDERSDIPIGHEPWHRDEDDKRRGRQAQGRRPPGRGDRVDDRHPSGIVDGLPRGGPDSGGEVSLRGRRGIFAITGRRR